MEFKGELEKLGVPIQYRAFQVGNAPELPYILFFEDDSDNFMADNHNYYDVLNVVCELYSDEKDIELETKLQKLLYDLEIEYNTQETFIDSENMYLKTYNVVIAYDSLADVVEKEVDKTNLKLLIDYAETLDADAYESASFKEFQTVLAYAKAILIDSEATQDEVYEIEQDLMIALIGLVGKDGVADKTELIEQVNKAKALDKIDYTDESYADLKTAITDADEVVADNNAKQSNVNSALIMLLLAIQALEKRDDDAEFYKGKNLYAPLYWEAQGWFGDISSSSGEEWISSSHVRSNYIKIPKSVFSIFVQTKSLDSFYIYFYDENKKYAGYEYIYKDSIIKLLKSASYFRMVNNRQTPSSVLINQIKIEFGEKTDWSIAQEDEQYMQLKLI